MVAVADEDGDTVVYVVPVTHTRPASNKWVLIPEKVKQHLRLDADRSWIVTSEVNRFIWPGYDLRPVSRDKPDVFAWGFLPVNLFDAVKRDVIAHWRERRLKVTQRS